MSKFPKEVVFVAALRTSIGRYKGIHSKLQAHELGSQVIKKLIKSTNLKTKEISEVIFGQVLTGSTGQNPARQAAIMAGIPFEKTALLINQVCGSGLRSIVSGFQSIMMDDSEIIISGGQESMSNSIKEVMLKDGLIDAFNNYHMGITAENVAEKWNITRREQDNFAISSQRKAFKAIREKRFFEEIIDENLDEHPRQEVDEKLLANLKPSFKRNGTVTAGNSSGINDGAAAVILMKRETAEKKNLNPLAKIVSLEVNIILTLITATMIS